MELINDGKIRAEWNNLRSKTFAEIERVLRESEYDAKNFLAHFVAHICGIDHKDMFSENKSQPLTYARWFYWYSLRYMFNETYTQIAQRTTVFDGHTFTPQCVGTGITKMTKMISMEKKWKDKWLITKRFIDLDKDPMSYHVNDFANPMPKRYKFMLNVPKGFKDKIDIEIKEI
jgi:hypothetical protein